MREGKKPSMRVRATFWLLKTLWMVGGFSVLLARGLEALSNGVTLALLLSWMLTLSVLNFLADSLPSMPYVTLLCALARLPGLAALALPKVRLQNPVGGSLSGLRSLPPSHQHLW